MESKLAIAAATWAIAMALGPTLQIRKILRHRDSKGVSITYFGVLVVGFVLWVAYGVAASNYALIIPNAVALVISAATIAIAFRFRHGRGESPGRSPAPSPTSTP